MTKKERLDALALFLRQFTLLIREIPEERRSEVRAPFCQVVGHYLEITEGKQT